MRRVPGGSGRLVASAPLQYAEFGLAHPGVLAVMTADPRPGPLTPAVAVGLDVLQRRVRRIALDGRLRMSEARAISLIQSVGAGTVLTLLRQPEERCDLGLLDTARDAVAEAITGETRSTVEPWPSGAAAALRSALDRTFVLTDGERFLLQELLDRIADGGWRALSVGPQDQRGLLRAIGLSGRRARWLGGRARHPD